MVEGDGGGGGHGGGGARGGRRVIKFSKRRSKICQSRKTGLFNFINRTIQFWQNRNLLG
jgi:hypothetical protein